MCRGIWEDAGCKAALIYGNLDQLKCLVASSMLRNLHCWDHYISTTTTKKGGSEVKKVQKNPSTCCWIFAVLTKMTKPSGGVYVPCIYTMPGESYSR